MNFLEIELLRTGGVLPPLQTGFGTMAHTVAEAFGRSSFRDLQFFCGGIGEAVLELMYSGTAAVVSTGGFSINERVRYILEHTENLSDRLILRNGDLINNAEIIGRLGVIALNTGIEIDIYGNVNSSHIAGTRVVNGIGGGANFAQTPACQSSCSPRMRNQEPYRTSSPWCHTRTSVSTTSISS